MEEPLEVGLFSYDCHVEQTSIAGLSKEGFSFITAPVKTLNGNSHLQSFLHDSCLCTAPLTAENVFKISSDIRRNSSDSHDSGIFEAETAATTSKPFHPTTLLLPFTPETTHLHRRSEEAIRFNSETKNVERRAKPQVWVHIPIDGGHFSSAKLHRTSPVKIQQSANAAYFYWHNLLCQTKHAVFLYAALELSSFDDMERDPVERWLTEIVGAVIIPVSLFWDTWLPLVYFEFVRKLIRSNGCKLMLRLDIDMSESDIRSCIQNMSSLAKAYKERVLPPGNKYLHITMQPLHLNLFDAEYAGFETDLVKYYWYEEAVYRALRSFMESREQRRASGEFVEDEKFMVAVVGCGRGPLVKNVLLAAKSLKARLKVFAVDKNPETQAILLHKLKTEWKDDEVELYFGDMRDWKPSVRLDIIVSELIGNFGCDECSPECLDAPEKLLKPDGISIPKSYSNWLIPVSATKLYQEARNRSKRGRQEMRAASKKRCDFVDIAKKQPVFIFNHGYRGENDGPRDNSRRTKLQFVAEIDAVLHGFTGFFKLDLYGDVSLSTIPDDRTTNLGSWDRVFFPIMEPIRITKDDKIVVVFERCCETFRVWYEWRVLAPVKSIIHNLDGEYQSFRLDFAKE